MHEHERGRVVHAGSAGAGAHAGHHAGEFLRKFWISLVLSVPIFFFSEMARELFGLPAPTLPGWPLALLAMGSIVYFYCGWVFLRSAYRELQVRQPGMMTLIAIAITAAYAYSVWSLLAGRMHDLMFELSSLITIMLVGHWIEMRSVASAQGALKELAMLLPDEAELMQDGAMKKIPLADLRAGDVVLVRPGARIPADGDVQEGHSDVNEAVLTGESQPVSKSMGSQVIAGSLNGDGSLTVRVRSIGEETFLAGVMRLVADAQASKSQLQTLADRAASYLTVVALVVGAVTFFGWLLAQAGIVTATERLVAVLVITCPHALGLAVPLVAAISTTMAARAGLLVRERRALENARLIDTVLFDKTGTLTAGDFRVVSVSSDEALALAAAVEQYAQHPVAAAIVAEARSRSLLIAPITNFAAIPGSGARAEVNGALVFVGHRGGEQLVVEKAGQQVGTIVVADAVRPEALEAIAALKRAGLHIAMVTGDSHEAAQAVAGQLGIDEVFARVRPDEKAAKVQLLQGQGRTVAMVGDGVNDAPALAQADLGVAIGAGTNVAIESAGIVLVKSDPRDIPKIFTLSRLTYSKMIQNLFWATGYNVVAIPLAAGVLAPAGIVLQPWLAAVFMSASTVIVAINALLLRRKTI